VAALTAMVTALSIGLAVNLLLTFAIVRRLRLQQARSSVKFPLPSIGVDAPTFSVEDYKGRIIDDSLYARGTAIVAFLTHHCEPCDRAKAELIRRPVVERLLVFLQAAPDASDEAFVEAAALGGAWVVLDPGSELLERFSVRAFPTFLRVRNGIVVAAGLRPDEVLGQAQPSVGDPESAARWEMGPRSGVELANR
jgi:hypothetical protein